MKKTWTPTTVVESGDTLFFPSGVYNFDKPIEFDGLRDVSFVGEEGTVFRGTLRLSADDFTDEGDGVFSAAVPEGREADAFYVGERKYSMARYPKYQSPDLVFGGYAADCIFPEKTKEWADPTGGYIHAMHKHHWGGFSYRIEGKNEDGTLKLVGGWQNNRQMGMHEEYRYAENIREEMTEKGEWYYDCGASRVYVRLCDDDREKLDEAEITVNSGFLIFRGCENITVEGITFERGARTFMETKEPLLRSDWTIYRGGAVFFGNSDNCTADRCGFYDIGSNGVFVDGNCRGISVKRTHFTDIGASAVCFVGHSDSVRNPLFEYGETQSLADLDLTHGPKSDNYPKNCSVEECLIEHVGTVEKQATGVEISMSYGITVKNCTIHNTSRAGLNISEGTFGGHRIEGCDVFDTVRETGDHGSFNSWGRDRYWHLNGLDNAEAHKYASLDVISPTVITRNRFRCDRGWDIDLDDGSSYFEISENLCLAGGIKLREGFGRTVKNNIGVNNGLHAHVWYPNSGDVVKNNIFFGVYSYICMPEHWGDTIDENILHCAGMNGIAHADALSSQSGQDEHSITTDCEFTVIPGESVIPKNPAIKGFENFPTEFGVRYAPLRKLAPGPVFPDIVSASSIEDSQERVSVQFGDEENGTILLGNIETDDEMSAYGTSGHNGLIVLNADEKAQRRYGVKVHDVITAIDGAEVRNIGELGDIDTVKKAITVLRGQKTFVLTVNN